jgi:tetratricopeptide (TPR) repeat protein
MRQLLSDIDRLVRSDLKSATRLADRACAVAAGLGEPTFIAFAEAGRGQVFHHLGQYEEANSHFDRAARVMQRSGLATDAARTRVHQVFTLTQMGRYADGLRMARSVRRLIGRRDARVLAQLETNVGHIYYRQDRRQKALEHYDRARTIFARMKDRTSRALVDFSRSNIFADSDHPDKGLALLQSAAAEFDRAEETLSSAQCRSHIAYINFLRGNYNAALTISYEVKERLTELGSTQLVAWCDLDISEILLALNAFEDAADSAESARSRFTSLGMPYESAQATIVRALAAVGTGQFERARHDLVDARAALASHRVKSLAALADTYLADLALRNHEPARAIAPATNAIRVFSRQKLRARTAHARMLLARALHELGDQARSVRLARKALRDAKQHYAPAIVYQCHHLIGRIERDRNRPRAALNSFRLAVEAVERMRGGIGTDEFKASFLRDKIEVYEAAISACLDEGSDELAKEAFSLVESSKSRALADLMARYLRQDSGRAGAERGEGRSSALRSRLLKLIEDLNWHTSQAGIEDGKGDQRRAGVAERYRREAGKCEREIALLFRQLEAEGSSFAEMQRLPPANLDDLRDSLEPGEVAVEYFGAGGGVSAFVASSDRFHVVRDLATNSELEAILTALRFQIEKFNLGPEYVDRHFEQLKLAADAHLERLYELVFAPLEPMINETRVVVIPHGGLHYVPFHALRANYGYVVDRLEFSYAPSAAVLRLCRQASARRADVSGGHSASAARNDGTGFQGRGGMVALGIAQRETPGIEGEIRELGSIFPGAIMLTGSEATRQNLFRNAPQARFLHLASHGYFRRDNPMFSFLRLADADLHFYNLLDLKLDAELVTLSACHTGVNMVFPGDELHGLMRGFLYAGAPSVVASLWAVSDSSTATFMREMYTRIRAGSSKRAALRAAQLAVRDAYGHPYYWAPFILMGDPD